MLATKTIFLTHLIKDLDKNIDLAFQNLDSCILCYENILLKLRTQKLKTNILFVFLFWLQITITKLLQDPA